MKLYTKLVHSLFGKAALATAALGGFLFLAGAPGAQAQDVHQSNRSAATSEFRYHRTAGRHGRFSPQARRRNVARHRAMRRRAIARRAAFRHAQHRREVRREMRRELR